MRPDHRHIGPHPLGRCRGGAGSRCGDAGCRLRRGGGSCAQMRERPLVLGFCHSPYDLPAAMRGVVSAKALLTRRRRRLTHDALAPEPETEPAQGQGGWAAVAEPAPAPPPVQQSAADDHPLYSSALLGGTRLDTPKPPSQAGSASHQSASQAAEDQGDDSPQQQIIRDAMCERHIVMVQAQVTRLGPTLVEAERLLAKTHRASAATATYPGTPLAAAALRIEPRYVGDGLSSVERAPHQVEVSALSQRSNKASGVGFLGGAGWGGRTDRRRARARGGGGAGDVRGQAHRLGGPEPRAPLDARPACGAGRRDRPQLAGLPRASGGTPRLAPAPQLDRSRPKALTGTFPAC
jgi:hypothetical protein